MESVLFEDVNFCPEVSERLHLFHLLALDAEWLKEKCSGVFDFAPAAQLFGLCDIWFQVILTKNIDQVVRCLFGTVTDDQIWSCELPGACRLHLYQVASLHSSRK